jgi:hypothetical protein
VSDEARQWQRLIESDDADPLEVLRTVGTYQRYLDAIEARAVKTARALGRSWEDVAGALGVKRQSAWAKHGPRAGRAPRQVGGRGGERGRDMLVRCPQCDMVKALRVSFRGATNVVVYDASAEERFLLPGPLLWTCPGCGREQSASIEVPGVASPILWERPQ